SAGLLPPVAGFPIRSDQWRPLSAEAGPPTLLHGGSQYQRSRGSLLFPFRAVRPPRSSVAGGWSELHAPDEAESGDDRRMVRCSSPADSARIERFHDHPSLSR